MPDIESPKRMGRPPVYPWMTLEIGGSFEIPVGLRQPRSIEQLVANRNRAEAHWQSGRRYRLVQEETVHRVIRDA